MRSMAKPAKPLTLDPSPSLFAITRVFALSGDDPACIIARLPLASFCPAAAVIA